MTFHTEDFNWAETESVVVPEQLMTAVYQNGAGDVVIRQGRYPDDDVVVVVLPGACAHGCGSHS